MKTQLLKTLAWAGAMSLAGALLGEEPLDTPRPIPLTRPELKSMIENVKVRVPRIPLPELTDKDREQLGDRVGSYEARLRHHYLAGGDLANRNSTNSASRTATREGFARGQDPKMTLDSAFKVELFWIVSRANNCQYCLGHQETKLLSAGLSEDRIARLDGDWNDFSPAERTAYAFARKYTYEPHRLSDEDITGPKKHFTDDQILEMMFSMAGNNSINRWKEGVGVPQNPGEGGYSRSGRNGAGIAAVPDDKRPRGTYLTPTSAEFETKITSVAPFAIDAATGKATSATVCNRPALESQAEVDQELKRCRQRASRLPLVDEAITRQLMSLASESSEAVPNWLRLLANFPGDGVRRAQGLLEAEKNSDLNPALKAQLSWIVARNDRAWYALGEAQSWLIANGFSIDRIFALDGDWKQFAPSEQALFRVAKNLGASPVVLSDREVADAVELAGAAAVVQTVSYVTQRAAFNRITEAAGLAIE